MRAAALRSFLPSLTHCRFTCSIIRPCIFSNVALRGWGESVAGIFPEALLDLREESGESGRRLLVPEVVATSASMSMAM
ncbi:hypothetical protein Busp01_08750 [Trinickia caryophylli]|nr:hypothetical protein Busp01_08750 [Trinickia caryophylli]